MQISVAYSGKKQLADVREGMTVLDALQDLGIPIQATCGGRGTCGRCKVLVADDEGTRLALACHQRVADGMHVMVDRPNDVLIVQEGDVEGAVGGDGGAEGAASGRDGSAAASSQYACDEGASGLGLAVDIGTTTVVAHLHDLATGERLATASCANPQAVFGADVISRISASTQGKLDSMTAAVCDAIATLRDQLLERVPGECVALCCAGNTVMQHIAAGLPPDGIGVSPFTPITLFGDCHPMGQLGEVYFAPCIAGYVGGDIVAGLLARGLDDPSQGTDLFIDLGTNGEMALAVDGRIATCATAAGPVFEGATIHMGMPASAGSISQIRIAEPGLLDLGVLGDGEPIGLCGTGIIDAIAVMLDAGIIDETGYLNGPDEVEAAWAPHIGEHQGSRVFFLTDDRSVFVTQTDVRNVQLAKAAVCAGARALMEVCSVAAERIESVQIAGGFGRYLNAQSAARIGLIPPELAHCAVSVGNTSAEGASMMLLSQAARERAQRIAASCEYLELSGSALFNELYVDEMEFPTEVSV